MRNFIFITLLALLPVISSCSQNTNSSEEEILQLRLPEWPPQDSYTQNYPALSRWHIQITTAEKQESFYTTENQLSISLKKNRPACIVAKPITLLSDNNECEYFKPAGFMYPFCVNDTTAEPQIPLTWGQGFLSDLMQKFFYKGNEEGLAPVETEYLISTFNWKKAQETIDKKLNTESQNFYNPWLLQSGAILDGITSHTFKASLLNLSNCTSISSNQLQNSKIPTDTPLISSFIPENLTLAQKKQFTVMKNYPIIIGDGNKYGIFATYMTAKNISLELIYLPIYIEDI